MKRRRDPTVVDPWRAFADLMLNVGLILIFFVMIQSIANSRALGRMQLEARQREMEQRIIGALGEHQRYVEFAVDGNLQRVRFASRILFDSGKATLKGLGPQLLNRVGQVLLKHRADFTEIQIEGHTDTDPVVFAVEYKTNWALSSARAATVVNFLQQEVGLRPEEQPISAIGRAEFAPLAPESGMDPKQEKEHNRRIELVLVYSERERPKP